MESVVCGGGVEFGKRGPEGPGEREHEDQREEAAVVLSCSKHALEAGASPST